MPYLWMLLSSFFYASMGATVKAASGVFSSLEMVGVRGLVAVLVLGIWAAATGRTMRTRYLKDHFIRSLCGTVSQALWFTAVGLIALSTAMTISNTTPLVLALIAVVWGAARRRKPSLKLIGSVLLGFAGVLIIFRPDLNVSPIGAGFALAGSIVTAGSYIQVSQLNRLHEPAWRVVFYFSILNCVFGIAGLCIRTGWVMPAAADWLRLAGIGVLGMIAQLCFTMGLRNANVVASSVISFAIIPFSAILGIIVFGESIDPFSAIGFACIFAAGTAATITVKKLQSKNELF